MTIELHYTRLQLLALDKKGFELGLRKVEWRSHR